MYPKQHPAGSPDLRKSMDFKKQQKRDQLAALLINKFRNKYQVSLSQEKALDDLIQHYVSEMVSKDQSMSEKCLRELDAKIAHEVAQARGGVLGSSHPSSKRPATDAASNYSKSSRARSHAHASSGVAKSLDTEELNKKIAAMTGNKGLGMTETEWNSIVMKNLAAHTEEAENRKAEIAKQRADMKVELQR